MLYFEPPLFVVDFESETAESHYGAIYPPHLTRYCEMPCFGVSKWKKRHENIFPFPYILIDHFLFIAATRIKPKLLESEKSK